MVLPVSKNKKWIAQLLASIDFLSEDQKVRIMKPAGRDCASDILALCEKYLGRQVSSLEELTAGWNIIREKRGLQGRWEIQGGVFRGVFSECGCPLVRSGLIGIHPVQCYCSQSMMETIFSQVAGKTVHVTINGTIARGDKACDFTIRV